MGAGCPAVPTDPGLIVYRFGADLFYANADRFADEVRGLVAGAPEPVRWFIIDCAAIFDLDYTAARTVRDLIDGLKSAQVGLVLARVNAFLRSDLVRHGVAAAVAKTGSSTPCMRRSPRSAWAGAWRARTRSDLPRQLQFGVHLHQHGNARADGGLHTGLRRRIDTDIGIGCGI